MTVPITREDLESLEALEFSPSCDGKAHEAPCPLPPEWVVYIQAPCDHIRGALLACEHHRGVLLLWERSPGGILCETCALPVKIARWERVPWKV